MSPEHLEDCCCQSAEPGKVIAHLEKRFSECTSEAHYNLFRQDIVRSFRCLYDQERTQVY